MPETAGVSGSYRRREEAIMKTEVPKRNKRLRFALRLIGQTILREVIINVLGLDLDLF